MYKEKLIEHLLLSRDGNTFDGGETGVQLTKKDINYIVGFLEIEI